MPFFSIIIPSYNQHTFLEETVQSVLQQTFSDFELLIVDDGSTDGSLSLAKELAKLDNRISVLEKENGGLSSARNFGIRFAKGDYLYFIDADDTMLPSLLEKAANLFKTEKPDVVQFGYRYLLEKDQRILHCVFPKNLFTCPKIFEGSPGSSHCFIFHKSIIEKAGYFDEELKSVEDWDYWIRVAKCNPKISLLHEALINYRQHELSMSRNYIVMYEAFKTVAFQSIRYDSRLPFVSPLNRSYDYDLLPILKCALLRFTALAVLQNKVSVAVDLFRSESEKYNWKWDATEFCEMNCYLTFRYRYNSEDLQWIFKDVVSKFILFFQLLNYSIDDIRKALRSIFYYHLCNRNTERFGLLGKVFNMFSFYPGFKY